jgi:acyl transferase domain-containing protein
MLAFVVRQSHAIVEQLPPGGMLTVLASSAFYRQYPEIFVGCALAAENFDAHIVVSGSVDALRRCCLALEEAGVSAYPLPVPFAFHSGQSDAVRAPFFAAAQGLALRCGDVPVISCVDPVGVVTSPDVGHLWRIVEQPFYFLRAIQYAEQAMQRPIYLDCSPSGTLANFLRYILGADAQQRVRALYAPGRAELALGNAL